ncbi:MAG: GNAT family N-acetyltransferase [Magnetococcales bacterium]|nr:GNAT family N-acetyltransferase [Magnetococcales bacterium]
MNPTRGFLGYDADWKEKYADLIATPKQALGQIRPGSRIFIGTGCSAPQPLIKALCNDAKHLTGVEIVHLITFGEAPYAEKQYSNTFTVNSFFVGDNTRDAVNGGWADYTPIMMSDIPLLFSRGQLPLDAALIQVTPPDERGMVSLGISVDIVKSAVENASLVIAQVNPFMPRTQGDSHLNVWDLDILTLAEEPLLEYRLPKPTSEMKTIGRNVAALIEDGSTIEVGIGQAPQSVLPFLQSKKHLGIHTELITDSILDLLESGAVDGSRKAMDTGKIITSLAAGTQKLYDTIHDNPIFSFQPTEYVNNKVTISQQTKMIAINSGLQVDLTGQVCADSIGTKIHSGIGGLVDFNYGAAHSKGGKAIIALSATADDGTCSRIVSQLSPGSGVALLRGSIHYIVTEYGIAYLHGRTLQDRAMSLISIAHPDFRAKLLTKAIKNHLIRPEMGSLEGKHMVGSRDLCTTMTLKDGTQINFRPAHPTDRRSIEGMLYSLSERSVYRRFMSNIKRFSFQEIKNIIYIDHRRDVVIVGTIPEADGEKIVAVGGYYLDPGTNQAEVAFMIRDDWQGRGLGGFLMKYLVAIAKKNGIQGFVAETLRENRGMQTVFHHSGLNVRAYMEEDVLCFDMKFC